MARVGVSYTEVAQAASTLAANGTNPTADKVREIIGSGSKQTILKHLHDWRDHQARQTTKPEGLPKSLVNNLQHLWQDIEQEAQEKIHASEQALQDKITSLETEVHAVNEVNQTLQKQLASAITQLTEEKEAHENTKAQLQVAEHQQTQLQERTTLLQDKIKSHESENQKLHEHIQHFQQNLEHYQEAIKVQQNQFMLQLDKQQSNFQQQIQALHEVELNLQNDKQLALANLEKAHQDNKNLQQNNVHFAEQIETYQASLIKFEENLLQQTKNQENFVKLQTSLQSLLEDEKNQNQALNDTILQKTNDYSELKSKFTKITKENSALKKEVANLTDGLLKQKD